MTDDDFIAIGEEWIIAQRLSRSHLAAFLAGTRAARPASPSSTPRPAPSTLTDEELKAASEDIGLLDCLVVGDGWTNRQAIEELAWFKRHWLGTELRRHRSAPSWLPIETAPKVKRILGGKWHGNKWVYAIGRWTGEKFEDLRMARFKASHYQELPVPPLPEPPK